MKNIRLALVITSLLGVSVNALAGDFFYAKVYKLLPEEHERKTTELPLVTYPAKNLPEIEIKVYPTDGLWAKIETNGFEVHRVPYSKFKDVVEKLIKFEFTGENENELLELKKIYVDLIHEEFNLWLEKKQELYGEAKALLINDIKKVVLRKSTNPDGLGKDGSFYPGYQIHVDAASREAYAKINGMNIDIKNDLDYLNVWTAFTKTSNRQFAVGDLKTIPMSDMHEVRFKNIVNDHNSRCISYEDYHRYYAIDTPEDSFDLIIFRTAGNSEAPGTPHTGLMNNFFRMSGDSRWRIVISSNVLSTGNIQ